MGQVAFKMWESTRQLWMSEHRFYIEQARSRLLAQFENLEAESEKAAEDYLKEHSHDFDPDRDDPADVYDAGTDKAITFFELLNEMRRRTCLSVVAGMYHEWDKKLREWVAREVVYWHRGAHVQEAIWQVDVEKVFALLGAFGLDAHTIPSYPSLNAMRLVVNVYKHGKGDSLEELKALYPQFVSGLFRADGTTLKYFDHSYLRLSDEQIDQFSSAILDFWKSIPEDLWIESAEVEVPRWFEKAFDKDRGA